MAVTGTLDGAVLGQAILGEDALGVVTYLQGAPTPILEIAPPAVFTTADQTFTAAPCDLGLGDDGELLYTPTGDLALVTGHTRVAQDVWQLAVTPLGSEYGDPAYGSPFAALVGRRMPDQQALSANAALLQKQVAALQQKRAQAGDLPGAGEAIASVAATATKTGPNTITAPLTVRTQAGQTVQRTVTLG